jgi:hypothetical protein
LHILQASEFTCSRRGGQPHRVSLAGRIDLEILGWALHILINIAAHQGIFAVHFLWPLSNYGFNGIRWEEPWFLAVNYGVLVAVLAWLWLQNRKQPARSSPALKSASTEPHA